MLFHIFKYRLKCMLKDKSMMFWTLMFPLFLGTFFNLAFSDLTSGESFRTIPIAIIENQAYSDNENLKEILKDVSEPKSDEKPLFEIVMVSEADAKEMLENDEISGIVEFESTVNLTFRRSGINQTIIKEFFDRVGQSNILISDISRTSDNPNETAILVSEFMSSTRNYFQTESENFAYPDYTLIYFYSLIGMACFYGSFVGIKEVDAIQADQSEQAKRVNVAPTKKIQTFITSLAGATLIQFSSIILLLGYLVFIVNVDFGDRLMHLVLLCIVGCICGVSFGCMVGSLIKGKEGVKTGILIGVTMLMSFLAGMMQSDIKYLVAKNFPLLTYINPVNAITDGLYALYFYPSYTRYFTNLGILVVFTILFATITILRLRRVKYASV